MKHELKRYIRDISGTIAIAFAIMAPVVMGAAGMALDYSRAYLVQQRLQQAIDSSALAAAAASDDPDVVEQKILDFFEKNYPPEKLGATFTPEVHIDGDEVRVTGHANYNTFFLAMIGIHEIAVNVNAQVTRRFGANIELAMVLDVSGSMNNDSGTPGLTKIAALRNAANLLVNTVIDADQSEYYTKVAMVPYGVAVNVGAYAADVRGSIDTTVKNITGITRANPAVVTSNSHGFVNGDKVYIRNVNGMTQINTGVAYTVANKTANTFQLKNYNNTSNINSSSYSSYSSGGQVSCANSGCQYKAFMNASGSSTPRVHQISTCVSERTGAEAYTDASPSTSYVGRVYPVSSNPCLTPQIVPLTSDIDTLETNINALTASGSTGGQVGVGWGWYMLSPEWGEIWPDEENVPGEYGAEDLHKIVVIMTDGEYNSPYCNGVIAADATSGSGNTSDHINCNATNGDAYTQAETMCDAMKEDDKIEIYAIGFRISAYPAGESAMRYCATDEAHFYSPDNGDELEDVFEAIANSVRDVYLSR